MYDESKLSAGVQESDWLSTGTEENITEPVDAKTAGAYMTNADTAALETLAGFAAKGNKDAAYELCRSVAKQVLFRTTCMINNRSDAEDAAQEVLLRVCSKIRELKNPEAFRGWLNTIIMNETRRIMAKNARYGDVLDIADYMDEVTADDRGSLPEECVLREDDCNDVMKIIVGLPEQQREAVVLHYFEDFSVGETAKAMGAAQGNISRALRLAREKIKNELVKLEYRPEMAGARLSALPVGPLASGVMRHKANQLSAIDTLWMQQTLTDCKAYIFGTAAPIAAKAVVAAKTASVISAPGAAAVSGIAAAIIVSVVALFSGLAGQGGLQESSVFVEGEIAFSGGSGAEHINPQGVSAFADSTGGELEALSWEIKESGSGAVLYGGEGSPTDEALSGMTERSEDGRYVLVVYMEGEDGYDGWLSREFEIRTVK